jgi:DNA-binding transcriptional ArsR family regulator
MQTKPMPDPQNGPPTPAPIIPLDELLSVISNPVRWRLLRELCGGDQHMVSELAERMNLSLDTTSKHLAILRESRIVIQGRNRLYQIASHFVADKSERLLDFGYCLLRLNVGSEN